MTLHVPGYRIADSLGAGACGEVFTAEDDSGTQVALKVFDPQAVNGEFLAYCLARTSRLGRTPGVLQVLEFRPARDGRPACCAMPLLADRSADGWLPRTLERLGPGASPAARRRWLRQIAQGLATLHGAGVIHCNLKPGNVFLSTDASPEALVADPGQGWLGGVDALPLGDHVLHAPPEQLRDPVRLQRGTGERWDVYAFGVLAFRLLTGRFPRAHDLAESPDLPEPAEFADILELEPEIRWPEKGPALPSARWRGIISRCLELDPARRPADMREVAEALQSRPLHFLLPVRVSAFRWPRAALWSLGGAATAAALIIGGRGLLQERELHGRLQQLQAEHDAGTRQLQSSLAASETALAEAVERARGLQDALQRARQAESGLRQSLASTQTAADHFFGSFLQAVSQLPPAADQERARLMVSAYDYFNSFIQENSAKPEFAEACLRARCHLAEIKLAMSGGVAAAEKFDEARQRIEQWLAEHPQDPQAAWFRLKACDCAMTAAQLRLAAGQQPAEAQEQLRRALAALRELAPAATSGELLRRRAEAQLLLARSLSAEVGAQNGEAMELLEQAEESLTPALADPKKARADDRLLLARVHLQRGRIERSERQIEDALATQIRAAELLLECGDQPEALYHLALCYGETAEMLDGNAEYKEAVRAHSLAIKVLSELAKATPTNLDYQFELAKRYADIAQIVRDHYQPPRALDYQKGSVEFLKALVARDPNNPRYAAHLAREKADLSDLLTQLGKKEDALAEAREAVALLDKLNAAGRPAQDADYDLRLNIAQTYGLAGHVSEEARQPGEAALCFSKAVAQYESLAAARADDTKLKEALDWTRTRLAKLKN